MKELELMEQVGMLQRSMMRRLAANFDAEGLTMADGIILKWMSKSGSCRVSAITEHSKLPASTVTGVLDRLVARGYLERAHDPEDRRAVIMKATPLLQNTFKDSERAVALTLEKSLSGLDPELIERLVADLALVNDCLEREGQGGEKGEGK